MAGLWVGTLIFLILGVGGAMSAPRWAANQTGLVKILIPLLAFCMWLSYALIYIAQMNPLILPTRNIRKE